MEESSTRYKNGLGRISQLKIDVIRLPGTDVFGTSGSKLKVGAELSLFYFRIGFGHFKFIVASVTGKIRRKSGYYPLYVVFVDQSLYFEVGGDDLPDMFAGSNGLADLGIEIAHLSIDGSFYLQVFHPLAYQGKTALHITDVFIETMNLTLPEKIVLPDAFVNDFQLCPCRFVLFGSQPKLLFRYQLLFDKAAVLLVTPLFHCQFLIQADAFLFQPQMFLLHADAGIAQLVLLIGQIGFALHDSDVQERIAETKNHIACLDDGSFLFQALFHTASFYRIHINDAVGHHLSDNPDVITELSPGNCSNGQPVFFHIHRRGSVPENKVKNKSHGSGDGIIMLPLHSGLAFDHCIHR